MVGAGLYAVDADEPSSVSVDGIAHCGIRTGQYELIHCYQAGAVDVADLAKGLY